MSLFIVSTPIGHLQDLSPRAREVLSSVNYILCEDTRRAKQLLHHIGATTPLQSYHRFSEERQLERVLTHLAEGQKIALISDAGTPTLSDPGQRLVSACRERELAVSAIPGPCAAVNALVLSGFPSTLWQCMGFLERKGPKRRKQLIELIAYPGTSILYEAPTRLHKLLEELANISPTRKLAILREMTKIYEECTIGSASKLLPLWKEREVKGEIVVVVAPPEEQNHWENCNPKQLITELQERFGCSRMEAIKVTAHLLGQPKSEIYFA